MLYGALTLLGQPLLAQNLGLLEGHADVGHVLHAGDTRYDSASGTYTVTGSGDNLWFTADQMQFAWKRLQGDVMMTAEIAFVGEKGNNHRKAALMLRQSLDPSSPYVDVARHGDGLTSLQFRLHPADVTREIETPATAPGWVRIVKHGDLLQVYVGSSPETMHFSGASMRLPLSGTYYAGLAVCSHDGAVTETALFRHLQIQALPPAKDPGQLWSTLETVKVASTDRRVAYTAPARLVKPRWSAKDGAVLLQEGPQTERFDLDPAPYPSFSVEAAFDRRPLPADAAEPASSDHGGWIYYSAGAPGASQLWRKHADGSDSMRLLTDSSDDLLPSPSPDGKWLVFLALPPQIPAGATEVPAELRLLSLGEGKTQHLATLIGGRESLASPSWSPDSTRVVFVSYTHIP